MKRRWIPVLFCLLWAVTLLHVSADYIGPQRTTTERVRDPENDTWTCTRAGEPPCHLHHENNPCPDCGGSHPSVEQQLYWCGWVADNCGCSAAYRSRVTSLPPAVVHGVFTCASPGNDGWCLGGAGIDLSAHDPLEGYAIMFIEGDPGRMCDPDDAVEVSCSWSGSMEGARRVEFWAHSTYGDTSEKGSAAWRVDTVPPVPQLAAAGGEASGGWYRVTPLSVRAGGTDASSGFASGRLRAGGGEWTDSITLTADGVYTFELQALDAAGNTGTGSGTVRLDSTAPSLSASFSGEGGEHGWHRSGGTAAASASDALSGVAAVEHQLDGGGWVGGAEVGVTGEGSHTVEWCTFDAAGNRTTITQEINIDTTPPNAALLSPQPTEKSWYSGMVHLAGACSDTLSGLAHCQVSLDGGGTWKNVSLEGGTWSLNIDTTGYNHSLQVIVRGQDRAGNTALSGRTDIRVDNGGPKVDIPDRWRNSQTVPVVLHDGGSGIRRAELWIDCGQYGKRRYVWRSGNLPDEFTWDRRVGDVVAPPGEYPVRLEAWDRMGNHRQDEGVIVVPNPPTVTPTITITLTPTETEKPEESGLTTAVVAPSSTPEFQFIVPTGGNVEVAAPEPAPHEERASHVVELSVLGMAGLCTGLGVSYVIDRRHTALHGLAFDMRLIKRDSIETEEVWGNDQ